MSEIRYDRFYDTHVIVAPERLHRPDYAAYAEPEQTMEACPFCEGNEAMTPPEIFALSEGERFSNEGGWRTRVVPNLYKAVQIEAPHRHHGGTFEHWEGFGAHEVIIDTPRHHTSMRTWNEAETAAWLKTLRARVADLRRDGRIAYISLFKNEGSNAGATQLHSHTQLIGLPLIPKTERHRYERCYLHYNETGEALLATLLKYEEEVGKRIIEKVGEFSAYCPYASAYPFEVMVSSATASGQIDTLGDDQIASLATLLCSLMKRMQRQLGAFHFNLVVVTPPLQSGTVPREMLEQAEKACRFGIRIMPRIYRHGGFEAGTDIVINPVAPELAAKLLRGEEDA